MSEPRQARHWHIVQHLDSSHVAITNMKPRPGLVNAPNLATVRSVQKLLILLAFIFPSFATAAPGLCEGLFQSREELTEKNLSQISEIQKIEIALGVPEIHRTKVSIVHGADGRPLKTKVSVVLMHGLYNSPASFATLAAHLHSLGMNAINLRLAGHYESDPTPMQETIRWQQWVKEGRRAVRLAKELGETVLLVGHSTGALTAAWLATENPNSIRGLALFSPAFRVQASQRLGAEMLEALGKDLHPPDGRLITGHAGAQVTLMANAFAAQFAGLAPASLGKIPVWMANTGAEKTIDLARAEEFFLSLTRFEPGEAPRSELVIPIDYGVQHNAITGDKNPQLPALTMSIDDFFGFSKRN